MPLTFGSTEANAVAEQNRIFAQWAQVKVLFDALEFDLTDAADFLADIHAASDDVKQAEEELGRMQYKYDLFIEQIHARTKLVAPSSGMPSTT